MTGSKGCRHVWDDSPSRSLFNLQVRFVSEHCFINYKDISSEKFYPKSQGVGQSADNEFLIDRLKETFTINTKFVLGSFM